MSHQPEGQEAEGAGHYLEKRNAPGMVGGHSDLKEATPEVQALADKVRSYVEKHVGPLKEYVVEQYKTQVVAGTNYSMKVRVDKDKYVHLKVFKPLGGQEPKLSGLDRDKSSGDQIGHITTLE
ncbi:hypothetical protein RvY_10800 [Ramazzottius varieornatus]|uniref:Cystatin domain-containing protein n=1 Tax=Ramazzottius varieornatus TaxID=947166 RepID=A0A1D1VG07_RAMVA|nr:hypothetical protein RvY_10800 [Ramazzottius varieornatus]